MDETKSSAGDENLVKAAEHLHDQVEYLLDDEIGYANSLRDNRKTAATLLVLVVGIGLFRFELYRPENHVLTVPLWSAVVIRVLIALGLLSLLLGAYFVYTERSLRKEFLPPPKRGSGSSLSVLYLQQDVLGQFETRTTVEVVRMKTDGLRLAYRRLRDANRRVRKRIAMGTAFVFLGLFLVLVAFGLYTVTGSLRVERKSADVLGNEQSTTQSQTRPEARAGEVDSNGYDGR